MTKAVYLGTGRRKNSIARVYLFPGKGNILINKRQMNEYLRRDPLMKVVRQPLQAVDSENAYDINVNVRGGGLSGQAGAIRLGIARALVKVNNEYRGTLKEAGYLTRDARKVERKKYGQPGARKRFQFSKR
jgi:small subunit ribosomal protein S9